ncbi:hypothetical protein AZE42_04605 [Rhizopogon vesiculosus]|uniref:Fungal-type protein kinase domain-containing protein n=1 Tax=Rhizopogon vesiculosus TaxID=180088 RepID=A0A1J8PXF7_9AGAM|nr:hypothetical protein AZE42_04605 [Rhizopogon vesiculosus]
MSTVGRPLWDAQTSEEFIFGSYAALKGQETLVNQGILHRDMSPGNLYVGEPGCPEGWEGFVADLELTFVAKSVTKDKLVERPSEDGQVNQRYDFHEYSAESGSKAPGAENTGTALFMARELLDKMLPKRGTDQKSKKVVRPAEVERGVHHDLESFVLVLFYAAMKRGLESKAWHQHPDFHDITDLYHTLFSGHKIREIRNGRSALVNPVPDPLFRALDPPMFHLLYGCQILLARQYALSSTDPRADMMEQILQSSNDHKEQRVITYEDLYKVYNAVILTLSNS